MAVCSTSPRQRAISPRMALEPLTGSTPDNFAAYLKSEIERWASTVKGSGASLE